MLKAPFEEIFEEASVHKLSENTVKELIEAYECEFGRTPKTFGELLEVIE